MTSKREGLRRISFAAVIAGASAAIAFGLHHISPSDAHHLEGVAALVLGAMLLVAIPVALFTARQHPAPPAVIVPRSGGVLVRHARTTEDLSVAAALHASELPHGFFVQLGPQFLREYDKTFAESPHAMALVAELDGHVVGMLVGTFDRSRHLRWVIRRRGAALATIGAASLVLRPLVGLKFLRRRASRYRHGWRKQRSSAASSPPQSDQPAVLDHVAVARGAQRTGTGSALVAAFEDLAAENGCSGMQLMTLAADQGAGSFYSKLGWTLHRTADGVDGTRFDVYEKALPC